MHSPWKQSPAVLLFLLTATCGTPSSPEDAAGGPDPKAGPAAVPAPVALRPADALVKGVALLRQGEIAEAIEILQASHEAHPRDASIAFYLGRSLHLDTKLTRAEQAYRDTVALRPDLGEAWVRLSEIYVEQGRLPEALECMAELEAVVGRGPQLEYQEGFVLSKMGRFEQAAARLQASLEARPENVDAWYIYGMNWQRAGDDARAVEAFQRALSLDRNYADAWFNMGNALARMGRSAEAEDALRRFAVVNEGREIAAATASNLRVLQRGAEMDLMAGNLQQVAVQVAEAESIDPGQSWVHRVAGELLLEQGQIEEGLQRLHQAAALNSTRSEEHLALAAAYSLAGDGEAAARHRALAERLLTGMRE